jgi:hypothetical protein
MRGRSIAILVIAAAVAGCIGAGTPSAAPPDAAPSSPVASGAGLVLQPAPANLGCDTMAVPYRSVTFKIDPSAADQVTASTDQGGTLRTFWSVGFVGRAAEVQDPRGQVVARDGDVLQIPQDAFPRLKGYFVCPSTDALYVLLQDPS